jgi:hypothetical protein
MLVLLIILIICLVLFIILIICFLLYYMVIMKILVMVLGDNEKLLLPLT